MDSLLHNEKFKLHLYVNYFPCFNPVHMCLRRAVCVCVCVRERERQREGEKRRPYVDSPSVRH